MIIHDIEQRSDEWFKLRAGMPTSSMFSKLITSKGDPSKSLKEYAITLAGAKYAGKDLDPFEGNSWTERGTEMEDAARSLYEFANDCKVEEVGFVTDDKQLMGCSPDGLVDELGLVEFKCLKAENHIKALMDYKKSGKVPVKYTPQVQGQMLVTGRKWCDLVLYHPELPLLVMRVNIDTGFCSKLTDQLVIVIAERDEILEILRSDQ